MPKSFIQKSFGQTMLKATRLTGMGKLLDATRLIQRTLVNAAPQIWPQSKPSVHPNTSRGPAPAANDPKVEPRGFEAPPEVIILPAPTGPTAHTPTAPPEAASRRKASFTKHAFSFEGESYPYRLFVPSTPAPGTSDTTPIDRKSVV